MASNKKYLIPNSITLGSLCMGVASITLAARGELHHALWLSLLCTLFDKFDGAMARKFKATSSFGVEMDSLADMVAFGVAPAVLVYLAVLRFSPHFSGDLHWIALGASLFYVVASALRLAKFNVIAQSGEFNQVFQGLPMPVAAGLLLAPLLLICKYYEPSGYAAHAVDFRLFGMISAGDGQHALFSWMVPMTALIGFGMISPLKVPKLIVPKTPFLKVWVTGHALLMYALIITRTLPEILLYIGYQFVLISAYFTFKLRNQPGAASVPLLTAMSYQLEFRRKDEAGFSEKE
ncbi:MAG: CDP-diacylglycerol--serine O-phosphatidyltransferase [Deltaproteobacteria bacterium HGW-Deltaproteobacteria-17]|nr:MAG: CDP-diacylglycerol--serine O-phosphatidyltransferase [Deltaproteobacteria bacterium HGW-Deltaproteobacteria-17]